MPAINRRLVTQSDLQDAMERQIGVRVFENNHIAESGGIILRFDDRTVVIQSGVGDLSYFSRQSCEFFELKKS